MTKRAEQIRSLLLRRCKILVVGEGKRTASSQAIFLSHLFQMGFVVDNPALYTDEVLGHYEELIAVLLEMRGGHVPHVPLFADFPDRVPEPDDYLLRRLLGYVLEQSRWEVPGRKLESGMTVPEWLFDLELFGADPITQRQDFVLYLKQLFQQLKRSREDARRPTVLKFLVEAEADKELENWLRWCLGSQTSFPEFYRAEISLALECLPDLSFSSREVPSREQRALYSAFLWEREAEESLREFCQFPTDLLRMLVHLTGGDVSLTEKVTFPKLKRKERRRLLSLLNGMSGPVVEDQLRKYRGLWLALERSLHSGEYRRLFPKACSLLERLRKGELQARFRELELGFAAGDQESVLRELAELPGGVALRRFCQTLALGDGEGALNFLMPRVKRAALKDQLTLYNVLRRDRRATESLILTKRGSSQVIPREPSRLRPGLREQAVAAIQQSVAETVVARFGPDSWLGKKIWIDPELFRYTVPTSLRSASDSLRILGRGSCVKLGSGPVLRCFVYWKQNFRTTDLDLSVVTLNDSFEITGHVDWTNLASLGLLHSGDLQSAPHGAAEFIDVKLEKAREAGHRYLGMVVFRFCGEHFTEMECFAGWMMREKASSNYKTFDIATVEQKLLLQGEVTSALPAVFDLEKRELYWLDLRFYGGENFQQVANSDRKIERAIRLGVQMAEWKSSLAGLAELHAAARGGVLCESREEADLVFSEDPSGDYHPGAWSRILSELL